MILDRILRSLVRESDLTVTYWNGKTCRYGNGFGTKSHIKFKTKAAETRVALDPDLHVGEAYMDGTLVIVEGTVYDFIEVMLQNIGVNQQHRLHKLVNRTRMVFRHLHQYNPVGKAKINVAHHYDLSAELYDLFLDRDRQYSCAYFEDENSTLEEAQLAKKRHLAAKLGIQPGMKVLDIGSGWGGLGLYLAEYCGAEVTGVTLSEEQHKLSNHRASHSGLKGTAEFLLKDYRHLNEKFDRIVSVGMFEHVGVGHFPEFFSKCAELLKDDGVAVLHSINRSDGPGVTTAWTKKYIFPGGYAPALSEVIPHMERRGLYITDIEILRLHYARTLREWSDRFAKNRQRAAEIYDERFCRMWELYLAGAECSFRFSGLNNFQIQFSKSQHVLPFTRNYIEAEENRLRKLEAKTPLLKIVQK